MARVSTSSIKDPPTRLAIQKLADALDKDKIITFAGLTLTGKVTIGSFGSPIDVTSTREYGFELHYSGNNYNVTGLRSRASLITTDTTASAQGALLQAANSDGINAGVLNGLLAEAIGKSSTTAATISMMRAGIFNAEWGAFDTVTQLNALHVRIHSLNSSGAGSFGDGYGIYLENEAVGGNGQALDAGIYFKGTNLSAGNKAFTYGIDFTGGTFATAELRFSNGETISNLVDGNINFNATKLTSTSGTFNLDNDNVLTTGTLASGIHTITGGATDALVINQGEDSKGIALFGYDDESNFYAKLWINSAGVGEFTTLGNIQYVASDGYIVFRAGSTKNMYFDGGGYFYFRDEGASRTIRATLNSANGWFALGTTAVPTVTLDVIGDAKVTGVTTLGDGGTTNYTAISSTGVTTLVGSAKVYKEKTFTFNYRNITAQGKPTLVSQGVFFGFSLPVYNNDDEELFTCRCMDSDWDGTTDPTITVGGWLDTANTSKKFQLQVSVETVDYSSNDVVPITTNDYPIETTTGTWAQYTGFEAIVTIDASAIVLAVGQPLAIRIRRIAASTDEIAGEVVVEGAALQYVANKIGGATV